MKGHVGGFQEVNLDNGKGWKTNGKRLKCFTMLVILGCDFGYSDNVTLFDILVGTTQFF